MNRGRTGGDVFSVDESSIVAISAQCGGTATGVDGGSVDHVDGIGGRDRTICDQNPVSCRGIIVAADGDISTSGRDIGGRRKGDGVIGRDGDAPTGCGQIVLDDHITVGPVCIERDCAGGAATGCIGTDGRDSDVSVCGGEVYTGRIPGSVSGGGDVTIQIDVCADGDGYLTGVTSGRSVCGVDIPVGRTGQCAGRGRQINVPSGGGDGLIDGDVRGRNDVDVSTTRGDGLINSHVIVGHNRDICRRADCRCTGSTAGIDGSIQGDIMSFIISSVR